MWTLLSLILSGLALSSGLVEISHLSVPETWTRDFLIFLGISAISSLGMVITGKLSIRILLLSVRIVTILLIGIPFGTRLTTEFYLMTALIIDISFALPLKPAIVAVVLSLAASLITQTGISAYYFKTELPFRTDLLSFAAWTAAFSLIMLYLNFSRSRMVRISDESDHRRLVIEELIGANRGYMEYASAVEQETADKERKRIITELHDVVGQSFTNILAITDMTEKHPPEADELADVFSVVKSQARYGLDETRAVLYKLHTFKATGPAGLKEFHRLISIFRKSTQLKVEVNWANLPWDMGREINDAVYKVIRESLINSFRHGKATRITIHFRLDRNLLFIDIVDNGKGSKTLNKGIGLTAMEERVAAVGGTIRFDSSEKEFSVNVEVPISSS